MSLTTTQDIALTENPFPGLRPFRTEETHLFFGREGQVDEVIEKLKENRFIAILGTSGSGKSSLMYCGLIPNLHGGFMAGTGSNWRVVVTRPGISPIRNLAEAIVKTEGDIANEEEKNIAIQSKQSILRSSSLGLVEIIKRSRREEDENILLLVDQFEELFRFNRLEDDTFSINESAAFVKLLVEVVEQTEILIYIVMTMRSDYIGDCAQYPQLTSLINDSHYLIPQMTRDQKREAILGPVAVGGGAMTPRLVQRLLNDLGENPDQLPILQHALMRTWDYWTKHGKESGPIDLIHYEAIGRMEGALSQHADEAFEELTKPQREICATLFKTLTEKGNDGRGVRRPTRLGDIAAIARVSTQEVVEVIERFRMTGRTLLMPPPTVSLDDDSIIDISHESLMRIWVRCREWVENEAEAVKTYLRLAEAATLYQMGKTPLWRPPDLQLALNWRSKVKPNLVWAQRYDAAFERTMVFLETSQKVYDDEQRSKDRLQKRAIQRQKIITLVLTIAVIGALLLVLFSYLKAKEAEENYVKAEKQTEAARAAESLAQQNAKAAEKAREDAQLNLEAAREAAEKARKQEQIALEEKRKADLQRQLAEQARLQAVISAEEADSARKIAEQQQIIAQQNLDKATKARQEADENAQRAERLRYLSLGQTMAVKSLRLSDTTQRALVAKQAYLFHERYEGNPYHPDLYDGLYFAEKRLEGDSFNILAGHQDAVRDMVVTQKREIIYSVGSDGRILRWNLARGAQQTPEVVYEGNYIYRSVALSTNNQWLACGTNESGIQLINLENPSQQRTLKGHQGAVWSLNFIENTSELISTGADQRILHWTVDSPIPREIAIASAPVKSVSVTKNRIVYGLQEDGKLEQWDLQNGNTEFPIFAPPGEVGSALAYSPQHHYLIQGYVSGIVYIWDIDENTIVNTLEGHQARIIDITVSPEGNFIATASLDGTVRIWQADNLDEDPVVLSDLGSWAQSTAFSANAQHIIVGTIDKTIRYYPTNMKEMSDRLCGKLDRNLTDEEWEKFVGKGIPKETTCAGVSANSQQ